MADYFHYMINHKSTIISTQLDMTDEYREGLIEQAYNIGDIQKRSTNLVGDMSSWKVWEECGDVKPVLDKIINISSELPWVLPAAGKRQANEGNKLAITSAWFGIYREGDWTKVHDHGGATVSFVYYLQADEFSAPLVFENNEINFTPRNNLLVLFPGYLRHSVPQQQQEGCNRVILAGNIVNENQ